MGYDSQVTRAELDSRGMRADIAHKGDKAPIQADTIITLPSLIRQAWTTHRWDSRPRRRP